MKEENYSCDVVLLARHSPLGSQHPRAHQKDKIGSHSREQEDICNRSGSKHDTARKLTQFWGTEPDGEWCVMRLERGSYQKV